MGIGLKVLRLQPTHHFQGLCFRCLEIANQYVPSINVGHIRRGNNTCGNSSWGKQPFTNDACFEKGVGKCQKKTSMFLHKIRLECCFGVLEGG